MSLLGRIIVILFALVVASLAAGLAVAAALFGLQTHGLSGDPVETFFFMGTVFVASTFAGSLSFFPAVILIALSEAFRLRSLIAHLVAGAALLAFVYASNVGPRPYEESIDRAPAPAPIAREFELAAAAGAVFGFIYWLIAGRNAGRWRRENLSPSS